MGSCLQGLFHEAAQSAPLGLDRAENSPLYEIFVLV